MCTGVEIPRTSTSQDELLTGILAKAMECFNVGENPPLVIRPSPLSVRTFAQFLYALLSSTNPSNRNLASFLQLTMGN